ncbi:glycerol-3-phosphate dehydrogenase [Salinibacterium xinjiangense]|uniref:Glycerol-3-phosphate dehydrogenase n=1 Tax=Salinibacterium xinjiangense TaxID=386302 RepID=A0A2C8ZV08_9MICO|nr:glycerol-3-phosphate dehydrogenase/oxidase [Salinibacterium xinjiangense]GGL05936.1 glycerol-3-phosphate dehydrogenase [Salinibacterium xinjiangense]SOE69472.1 glycerol-3-phosphate dehydrogenase [Salinibacterium xinjiangense]
MSTSSVNAHDTRLPYDLVVVGAGINGLGIARDAAARGLRTIVIDQEDICSGVSAWSGRLIHGGLRYLEHKDFALVRESLKERERLFKLAPHLVKPVPLLMPFYARNKRPSWLIRLGMIAYDVLSWDKKQPNHTILTKRAVLSRFTGMEPAGLSGSAVFIDGQVEYAERLCVELAVAAQADGADVVTHSRVDGLLRNGSRVTGVQYTDSITGERHSVHGRVVMNAAGPWIDRLLTDVGGVEAPRFIGGSKGSHIIVAPFPGAPHDVVYYESQADGRLVLVIPWMDRYLIGCTDNLYDEEPDSARAEQSEIDYLLHEVNTLVPGAKLTTGDVLYTYSGVRPLPYAPGVPEWKIPRSHIIHDHADEGVEGLFTVIGGKLTTFRQLSEDAVDLTLRSLGLKKTKTITLTSPLPGARVANYEAFSKAFISTGGVPPLSAKRLLALYGVRAADIAALANDDAGLLEVVDEKSGALAAEVVFAIDKEFARTLTDVMARRLLLAFEPGHGIEGARRIATIMGAINGWNEARIQNELDGYVEWLDHLAVPGRPAVQIPGHATSGERENGLPVVGVGLQGGRAEL